MSYFFIKESLGSHESGTNIMEKKKELKDLSRKKLPRWSKLQIQSLEELKVILYHVALLGTRYAKTTVR